MTNYSETDLLLRYKSDYDQRIIAQLYKPYLPMVYGLCMKYFKNPPEAEDASMDIYLSIVKKLKTHNVDNFKSWLYVVTKNHCLDKLRSKKTRFLKETEAQFVYSDQVYHPDIEEDEEAISKLSECLDHLNEVQRKSIDMFYYQKLTYKEIAADTGWSWSNIRSYIQNGRRNLKNCMER